ncbi:MAG TPA: nuclear transport factor 2 family protein [Kofleriaceae bacterium]|nr:nuclear transport factor 2 family protein [Kofleriaceae bacterium]
MTRATSDACTISSPREVFERARRSIVACDANGFADMFAPDGVMEFPFGGAVVGLPACLEGREQIRRHLGAALARSRESGRRLIGYDAVVVHQTTDPEVIIAEFDLHGEVSATGQRYQLPYIQVFRIRDGAIVSMRDYFSVAGLAEVTRLGTPAS